MVTELEISLGDGHATLNLDVDWRGRPQTGRWVGILAVLLVSPVVLVVGAQALGVVTGRYRLDDLLRSPGAPWVYLLAAGTVALVVAFVIVLVARLHIAVERSDTANRLTVTLRLTVLEAVAVVLAAAFIALFVVHLVADGLACARGVSEAC